MRKVAIVTLTILLCMISLQSCGTEDVDWGIEIEEHEEGTESSDNTHKIYIDELFNGKTINHQSAACYNSYVFLISNQMTNVLMLDMQKNSRVYLFRQQPIGVHSIYHCNQAFFGTERYLPEDYFPLLYISQFQNKDNRCFLQVYRIITYTDDNGNIASFDMEKIQAIFYPIATEDNCLSNVNAVLDSDNGLIYTYSRNNNANSTNAYKCKITCFVLPDFHDDTVSLSEEDIIDSFFLDTQATYMQGGTMQGDRIYITRGSSAVGYINLFVIDVSQKRILYDVDLLNNGYRKEPEGVFIYDGILHISTSGGIYRLSSLI